MEPPRTVTSYIIRQFAPPDLTAVMTINKKYLPENYPAGFFMKQYKDFPEAFLVAEADEKIVGYMMCRLEKGISSFQFKYCNRGHIVSIAISPKYRRQKIGTNLLKKAVEAIKQRGIKEIFLEVRVTNSSAIDLYEKEGFTKTKVIPRYYRDGESAYVMAKKLG